MHRFWLVLLLASTVGGCASMRSFVSNTTADVIPAWAGGEPADVPPRPGEPGYEKFRQDLKAELAAPKGGKPKDGSTATEGNPDAKASSKH
jgi:hypothetical protein